MHFTRLHIVATLAGLFWGPALISAGLYVRRGVECFFEMPAESGETCESLASSWGISVNEFININPGVTCPNLEAGKNYCVVGEFTPDEPTTSPSQPSSTTPSTTTKPTTTSQPSTTLQTTTTTTAPSGPTVSPVMPGVVDNCDGFYKVQSGDNCDIIAQKNGITVAQLKTWNTDINAGCTNLWADYYICTHVPGAAVPTTTMRTTTTTTAAPGPTVSPVMPGAAANCDRYYKIQSGDGCDSVASKAGITVAQLKAWNTEINASCSNLWLDYYVCTHSPGAVTPTTTKTTAGTPGPTNTPQLPGAVGNCDKWYKIASGDTCDTVAAKNKITVAMFRSYNTQINSACNNNLLKDYYACVSIPGAATPMPGIVSNCSRFYKVVSGDSCDAIANKAGITVANFRKWNTQINSGCTNLWLDALVCTNA
ncbi:LysM domain-containing protein-like protein 4 [Colletotrichum chrysophilum]|uniref:LysM domain-containing protein-like protein 4 n=2 Tax=Colletotrichum chrysophilum TaxID=1836956 RepID=A0AAD8ZZU3_9PEZI|nr:LysM domain-containing protein-like protein 4 [Colletotrichum chrysophilum]